MGVVDCYMICEEDSPYSAYREQLNIHNSSELKVIITQSIVTFEQFRSK